MQCCVDDVCKLIVVSGTQWKSATVDSDTAITLLATLSEDPANWNEVQAYWPRYRTPVVPQHLNGLQFSPLPTKLLGESEAGLSSAEKMLPEDGWLFINFDEKRVVTSPSLSISGHNRVFDLFSNENPEKRWPLSIHLPPWWELVDGAQPLAVNQRVNQGRSKPLVVPQTNREFLFGKPCLQFLAQQILASSSARVYELRAEKDKRAIHTLTVEIHRAWLMTPREELGGLMPRQLLHGAHDWISRVVEGQALRAHEGCPLIATPTDVKGFESAAMGLEEVVIYFDLCRHLIDSGWDWLSRTFKELECLSDLQAESTKQHLMQKLVACLEVARETFMTSSYEGGSTPNFIIQCSRRRVPRSSDIAVEGFDEQEPSQHIVDCECPLCLMMAEGAFGPGFTSLDGHHLELDEEFAFSLFETYQQWQEESLFFSDESYDDESDDDENVEEEDLADEDENDPADDEFASVWDGIRSTAPLPGDPLGHIKLAFMLAEIVSALKNGQVEQLAIRRLNDAFRLFRQADFTIRNSARATLVEQLELLTVRYPQLIPRIADFQSQLNEPVQRTSI